MWLCTLLLGCVSVSLIALARTRWKGRRHARLARREDANGRRLLQVAAEIERHARKLEAMGLPGDEPRLWARICQRVAVEHLACINTLLLEPESADSLARLLRGDRS